MGAPVPDLVRVRDIRWVTTNVARRSIVIGVADDDWFEVAPVEGDAGNGPHVFVSPDSTHVSREHLFLAAALAAPAPASYPC